MKTNIVFIHGADASSDSFGYIEAHLPYNKIYLSYKSTAGFFSNLKDMVAQLKGVNDIFIVAHSLGGVYALHLAEALGGTVKGVVSLATPFNGSNAAILLNMLKPYQLYRDISPHSKPIRGGHDIVVRVPWTAVITTKGHSHLIPEANDGVVTDRSMRHRKGVTFVEAATGHHEVMTRKQTVDIISTAMLAVASVAQRNLVF